VKRVLFVAFCILALCSLILANAGTVKAATASGYERTDYSTMAQPIIDGTWTSANEWTDGEVTTVGDDLAFRSTWDMPSDVYTRFLVEFFSDNTSDAGDYWEMCLDFNNGGGTSLGGSGTYYRIYIEGHSTH
jgi:hypothetical protein